MGCVVCAREEQGRQARDTIFEARPDGAQQLWARIEANTENS